MAAIIVSTVLYFMNHWGRAFLPEIVVRVIPGRLINIQAGFVMAFAIGMAVFVSDELASRFREWRKPVPILFRYPNAVAAAVAVVLLARFLPGFIYMVATAPRDPDIQAAHQELADIDSPFWSKVRALKINRLVLVPSEISLTALRYGRLPIALESAIDFIPYLPRTATALAALIERGYGVSFLHPPPIIYFRGIMPPGTGRSYWACLTPVQWQKVAEEFDVGAVLRTRRLDGELAAASVGQQVRALLGARRQARAGQQHTGGDSVPLVARLARPFARWVAGLPLHRYARPG